MRGFRASIRWLTLLVGAMVCGGALATGGLTAWAEPAASAAHAVQAIEQAADPSAVVAAYGSGLAVAPDDPQLHGAYVSRMVEMGLPELAYHQAQTLTTLQPDNGLAWGVVAYVDARRGQMPEAVSAINLAAQFAPTNTFVAHTAGEVLAWYDLKADKATLPSNAQDGLARTRSLLQTRPAFTAAYSTAQKAYQTPASGARSSTQEGPAAGETAGEATNAGASATSNPGAYAPQAVIGADQVPPVTYVAPGVEPIYSPVYYPAYYDYGPDYCYDWGPGWIAPSPWCWWQPFGYWGGPSFYSFGLTFAFGDGDDFHHSHHGHGYAHDGGYGHYGGHASGADPVLWHGGGHGRAAFFGTPARPASSLVRWNHQQAQQPISTFTATQRNPSSVQTRPLGNSATTHWWSGNGSRSVSPTRRSVFGTPRTATAGATAPTFSRSLASPKATMPAQQQRWGANSPTGWRSLNSSRAIGGGGSTVAPARGGSRSFHVAPALPSTQSALSTSPRSFWTPRQTTPASRPFSFSHSAQSSAGNWGGWGARSAAPAIRSGSSGFSGGGFHSGAGIGSESHGFSGGFSGGHAFSGGSHGGGFGGGGFRGGGHR